MIPDIPQHKKEEQAALAAALRKHQRAGGKITKLPGLGMPGKDTPMWNGRTVEALQSITRARNNGLRKISAAAKAKRAATAATKRRNKQVLREDWTELDKDNAA